MIRSAWEIDRRHEVSAMCPRGWDKIAKAERAEAERILGTLKLDPAPVIAERRRVLTEEIKRRTP